jgi:hypothetical protein
MLVRMNVTQEQLEAHEKRKRAALKDLPPGGCPTCHGWHRCDKSVAPDELVGGRHRSYILTEEDYRARDAALEEEEREREAILAVARQRNALLAACEKCPAGVGEPCVIGVCDGREDAGNRIAAKFGAYPSIRLGRDMPSDEAIIKAIERMEESGVDTSAVTLPIAVEGRFVSAGYRAAVLARSSDAGIKAARVRAMATEVQGIYRDGVIVTATWVREVTVGGIAVHLFALEFNPKYQHITPARTAYIWQIGHAGAVRKFSTVLVTGAVVDAVSALAFAGTNPVDEHTT